MKLHRQSNHICSQKALPSQRTLPVRTFDEAEPLPRSNFVPNTQRCPQPTLPHPTAHSAFRQQHRADSTLIEFA